jgi:hypothetical protein
MKQISLGFLLLSSTATCLLLPHVSVAFFVAPSSTLVRPTACFGVASSSLFVDEEEEMIPIAENYLRAKYRQQSKKSSSSLDHGGVCDASDVRQVLRSLLPPVTPDELELEVNKTLDLVLTSDTANTKNSIHEDCFVKSILQNSYWSAAGSLVVKELMYFDALYSYYRTGTSLLSNDDYANLKENLNWEGSSVATMKADEALFVTAVAGARRGDSIMDDEEYLALKARLKTEGSWVTARGQDALEKLGLNTFLGYLHRAL